MRLSFYRGKYCIYWREDGKPKRLSLRTADKDIAEQRFRDTLKLQERKPDTIEEIFFKFAEEKPQHEYLWKSLKFFKNYREDEITRDSCRKYAEKRRNQGIADGSIHKELGILRAAIRRQNKNTPAVFELPSKPPPKDRYLTKEEYKKLLGNASSYHTRLFIILALTTGARTNALLELTWDRVDFENRKIDLGHGTKIKQRATVPINNSAMEALLEAQKGSLSDYVIEYAGGKLKSIRKGVKESARRAGLKDVTPHVLRHTAAVWMIQAGEPIEKVAQYLGHTSPDITFSTYARYSPQHLQSASQALEID